MHGKLLVAAGATLLIAAPAAQATNLYCVHQASESCSALFGSQPMTDEGANLEKALSDSNSGAIGNGIVQVGPGRFTSELGFTYSNATKPTTINGSGIGRTVLEATGSPFSVVALKGPPGTALTDATVNVTPNVLEEGMFLSGPNSSSTEGAGAFRVDVANSSASTSSLTGVKLQDGAILDGSTVVGGATVSGLGVNALSGSVTLADDTISGGDGLVAEAAVSAKRLRISSSGGTGVDLVGAATSTIDGVLSVTTATNAFGVNVGEESQVTIRSGTFVNTSGSGTGWAVATLTNAGNAHLTVHDSIQRGFEHPIACEAIGGKGTPQMTLGFDDVHLTGTETCLGGGSFEPEAGNIDADPLFADPSGGDYHLRFGSPAIDAGGPTCNAPCQESDLDGLVRPIDGNGDGSAIRDMGAYEYGRRPPSAVASASPAHAVTGEGVVFSAAGSSDPDPGDALTYAWTFDDGATASGATATHAFAAPGTHTGTLVVTDPAGLTASAVATVAVSVAPSPSAGAATSTPARRVTPPVISSLTLSPSRFEVGSAATAVAAGARHRAKPKGTKISFALSETATSTLTIARQQPGIELGHACVAPSRRHRRGRRCKRYAAVGTLTRRSLAAGSHTIAFSGRIGRMALARGDYRLTVLATDLAGNRSSPANASFTII